MPAQEIEGWVDELFRPRINIQLLGLDRLLTATIDTSYGNCLCVSHADALEAGLIISQGRRQQVSRFEHPAGSMMVTSGRLRWFETQINIPIFVADDRYPRPDLLPRIGVDLISDCLLKIDFSIARVILRREQDQPTS